MRLPVRHGRAHRDELLVASVCAQYGIGNTGWSPVRLGRESDCWLVDDGGRGHVVKCHRRTREDRIAGVISLHQRLHAFGIPCARIRATRRGRSYLMHEGRPVLVMERLPGRHPVHGDAQVLQALAAFLAGFHAMDVDTAADHPRGWSWMRSLLADESIPSLLRDLLADELNNLEELDAVMASLPGALVHGDLFRDNVLFHQGRISGLLDFDHACSYPRLYDLAVVINDWCCDHRGVLNKAQARTFLGYYHQYRPLTGAEERAWPLMLRLVALRFWFGRIENGDEDAAEYAYKLRLWNREERCRMLWPC